MTVMQSTLPSLYVTLPDGVTLADVHRDKNVKYAGTGVNLTVPSGTYADIAVTDAQFKGRGNSSWAFYEKKGYQIKFDKKTSVLGMPKAKKWVLLANACDDSMMRNYLAFDLARQMGGILYPKAEYAELWINGDYRGTYLIAEKVEIGSNRVDLNDDYGAVFEFDDAFYREEDYWFYCPGMGHFTVKESVKEDADSVNESIRIFEDKMAELFDVINTKGKLEITLDELDERIDVKSVADYYLVNEFLRNDESIISSFYWYLDGESDVLHLGPVWDFDSAALTEPSGSYVDRRAVFMEMLNCQSFNKYVNRLYQDKSSSFASLPEKCEQTGTLLAQTAKMNYIRWNSLGTRHAKGFYHDTYDAAVSSLSAWLTARGNNFEVMPANIFASVSADCRTMSICLSDYEDYDAVWFPTWSEENGQDDCVWYVAEKQANGDWTCTVDMARHNTAGMYRIHVYGRKDGVRTLLADTTAYAARAVAPRTLTAEVSADSRNMTITLRGYEDYSMIWFPTWSAENGQDDIVSAVLRNGTPSLKPAARTGTGAARRRLSILRRSTCFIPRKRRHA